MNVVHACPMIKVNAGAVIILHACAMIIVRVWMHYDHSTRMYYDYIAHACTVCTMFIVHACTMIIVARRPFGHMSSLR